MNSQTQKTAWVTPALEELRMADTSSGPVPGMETLMQLARSPS